MPYRLESHGFGKAMRCAVCEGKFGLARALFVANVALLQQVRRCFEARRQSDHIWMGWFQIAVDQSPENRARAS